MSYQASAPQFRLRIFLAATVSFAAMGFVSAPAFAGKRKPAPIVYAGQGSATTPNRSDRTRRARPDRRSSSQAQARVSASTAATPGRRVEFRYPDQPDRFYGVGGVRSANDAPPLSFSSSENAITEAAAREYSNSAPAPLSPVTASVTKDPAITSGGFDARAAAARVAQKSQTSQSVSVNPYVSAAGVADFSEVQAIPVRAEQASETQAEVPVSGAVQSPAANPVYDQVGTASVFHADLSGQPTANGEILDMDAMIAAHPTLPLPSLVQVINLENNTEIVVRVNDRGPFDGGGLIELSSRAADVLDIQANGTEQVRVKYLGPAPVAASVAAPSSGNANGSRPAPTPAPAPSPRPDLGTELAGGRSSPAPQAAVFTPRAVGQPSGAAANDYYVQLGSFSNIANAQGLHAKVSSASSVEIVPVRVNGSDFFRVIAGPVGNRDDADMLRAYLANQGIADGVVINPR